MKKNGKQSEKKKILLKKKRNYLTEGKKTRGNSDRQGICRTRSEQNQEVKGKMAAKRKRMI